MDEEEPLFAPNSSFFWAVMHHVFMAAIILLIDVCFNWDDILAEKRKEEVLGACRMLSRAQQSSSVTREGINAMMGILRRHWKRERRPDEAEADLASSSIHSTLEDQQTPHNIHDSRTVFESQEQVFSSSYPAVSEFGQTPLEDLWSEMLDSSGNIGLETPDWMDLLTDLTNATAPCE